MGIARGRRFAVLGAAALCAVTAVAGSPVPAAAAPSLAPAARSPLTVSWMPGFPAPGTPARYNRVGILKIGPARARNVLVLEPGTSAGSAYFVPLAKWVVAESPGWQVWSVERRENLLEDQSALDAFKAGRSNPTQLFDYYLGYLKDPSHPAALPVGPRRHRGLRQAVGHERRRPGPAPGHRGGQAAGRQGGARRPLAGRLGGDGVRHLGLPRPRRCRRPGRAGLHRRRQRPDRR